MDLALYKRPQTTPAFRPNHKILCETGARDKKRGTSSSVSAEKASKRVRGKGCASSGNAYREGFSDCSSCCLSVMRIKCLSLLLALSILLAVSGSEAQNSGDALCHNRTHCVCMDGFQSRSGRKYFTGTKDKCEDIDECKTGQAKCKDKSFCKNRIGSYICSCLISRLLFWAARFIDMDRPECYENPAQKTPPQENVWELLAENVSKKEIARWATKLLHHVEMTIWNQSFASPGKGNNTELNIVYETKKCHEKTFLEAGNNTMSINCADAFKGAREAVSTVALITYQSLGNTLNGSFFNNSRGKRGVKLNSRVVSGTVGLQDKVYLSEPVSLTFQHTQPGVENAQHFCVFWEGSEEGGSWSTEGCLHVGSSDSYTTCKCHHLSSFAVLMALSPKEDPVLKAITYGGLSLSLLCLVLAALTFVLCRPIQNTGTTLHLHLALCLLLAHCVFLIGIKRTEPQILCSVTAGLLHYLYLAAFTWMLLEGLHLFLTVRNLKVANYTSASRLQKRFMYPLGYGIPAAIVTVCAIVGHKNYGTSTHCWLRVDKGFLWGFLGPVAVIISINFVFYFQVLWILRSKLSSLNKEVSTIQDTRVMTFKAIAQFFLLGCSWGLGFFLVEGVGETVGSVIAYLFTIINVLQGVLLFVVHCLLNHQVRMEYKKWFGGVWKGVGTDSADMSRSTTHTKM
ncbi:PREDICTED: adhesion G protein-coupled receptor E3 isoform X2 [Chinchilla lanigera]|uniref:adhesion G protein-coupled receptor E3 isoform X2 n=1 Tax=Chinchilla lanigera TaxID=34839 RepID=UPI00038F155A|nr:PREDICTED: adhesion G protein-coupled receptor E3 isoform X2 [Chinchilla lanigera]